LKDDTTEEDFVKYLYSMALGIEEFERLTSTKDGPYVSTCDCEKGEQLYCTYVAYWNSKLSLNSMLNSRVVAGDVRFGIYCTFPIDIG
jgi:hypothetical protein